MANNSASTYRSHSVRILSVCPFSHAVQFFPCGWVPNTFENMVALNTAVDLKSLHSQFRRASVRHALKALRLRHKYSSKSPNLNFANIKIQPFFAISPNLMLAKFSRYTVVVVLSISLMIYSVTSVPYGGYFGRGTGPLLLYNPGCTGTESSLLRCSHSVVGIGSCSHSNDAGVVCSSCKLYTWALLCAM